MMMCKQTPFSIYSLVVILFGSVFVNNVYAAKNPEVIFETAAGSFNLELYQDKAPITVANFLKYVDSEFYNGTIFHRVIKDFVVQGGGYKSGFKSKQPNAAIKSESSNGLKNIRGSLSMARRNHPDTATSQFYINLNQNSNLDYKSKYMPGYTVFGKISKGMDVIDKISRVKTGAIERRGNVPLEDVVLISAKRVATKKTDKNNIKTENHVEGKYIEGEHYIVLDNPVPTRDRSKVEVIELFSYGCAHCYEFEALVKNWAKKQSSEVDFWFFPAVWNEPMRLFAQAFYAANKLNILDEIHVKLFRAVVIEQKSIRNTNDMITFFVKQGFKKLDVINAFNSKVVSDQVKEAQRRVREYKPAGAPEIIVNGKYRVDRMRAGGKNEMLAVVEFLIHKELSATNKAL